MSSHHRQPLRRSALIVLSALLPLGITIPAMADTAEDGTMPVIDVSADQTASNKGYVTKRDRSATKTSTPLIETPQSITVVNQQQIEEQAIQGMEETLRYVAGAVGGAYGFDPRSDWMIVRGFNPARYLDGLALPNGVWTGDARMEPYGMERVDILKGPASVLYGQMPPGGMVNMVSKRPTLDMANEVELGIGSFDAYQAAFDLGGKLDSDGVWLYRLTGLARDANTPVDYGKDDRYYIAPTLTWQPSERTSLTLLARYQYTDSAAPGGFLPSQGTLNSNPNGKIPQSRFTGEPGFEKYERTFWTLGYEFAHRFDEIWAFRQNFRYAYADVDHQTVGANGLQADLRTLNRYYYAPRETSHMTTVDNQVQADFNSGDWQHTVLMGLDYRQSENDYRNSYVPGAPTLDIFSPRYGAALINPADTSHEVQKQNQLGLYAQDQARYGGWVFTLSGRYDWVDTQTDNRLANTSISKDDNEFSGRAGVNYVFDNGIAPYIAYSHSFQPTAGTDFSGKPFDPTTGEQYELGVKYQPPGSDSLLTLATYQLTQQNALTNDPNHLWYSVQQGEVRVRGVELEARVRLADGLDLIGSYAYTDAKVTESNDPLTKDKQVTLVPRNQASLWLDYKLNSGALRGLGLGGGVRYVGSSYGDSANLWEAPDYTLVDAVISYDIKQWRFQLNANNLFDKEYITQCNGVNWCYYGYPRTVTLTARYRW